MYNNTNIFLILQQFRIIPQHVGKSLIWIEKYFYIWGIIRRKFNPPGDILPVLLLICGIHPHVLAKNRPDSEFHKLKAKLEEYPQAVGIGEIGLDYTTTCRCFTFHNSTTCRKAKIFSQHTSCVAACKTTGKSNHTSCPQHIEGQYR